MAKGTTPPRWMLAAGAWAAGGVTLGAGLAVSSLWGAGRFGALLLRTLGWLCVFGGLGRRMPGLRAERARREAKADVPGRSWRVVVGWVAAAVGAALVLRLFVVGTFQVVSASMAPTLLVGDLLVVDRTAYLRAPIRRGDVIVWTGGNDAVGHDYVKRVVGLPGDVVEQRGRALWINGRAVPMTLVGEVELGADGSPTARTRFLLDGELWQQSLEETTHQVVTRKSAGQRVDGRWVVGEGQLFVMGDNRDDSVDSRSPQVGQVPLTQVAGRVRWVLASRSATGWRTDRFFHVVR